MVIILIKFWLYFKKFRESYQGLGGKKSVYRPRERESEKGLKKFFDRGIRLVLDRKFYYHYKYIQIHACENGICEYRNVEARRFDIFWS